VTAADAGDPGTDLYPEPTDSYHMEVGILRLASGTSLVTWHVAEARRAQYPDCTAMTAQPTVIAGRRFILQEESCPLFFVRNAYQVSGRAGFLIQFASSPGSATEARATLLAALATLKAN